jgi:hypothetical protein
MNKVQPIRDAHDGPASVKASHASARSYQIKVEGHLDECWSEWLGGLEITRDGRGNTLLRGVIPDQAALHGVLTRMFDLGLTLVSLSPQRDDVQSIR